MGLADETEDGDQTEKDDLDEEEDIKRILVHLSSHSSACKRLVTCRGEQRGVSCESDHLLPCL